MVGMDNGSPDGVPMLRGADMSQILEAGSTTVIGRAPDCDLVIPSRSVSARHAAVELIGSGDAVLHDLNSLNGTFVNDNRLKGQRVTLKDGDTLRFGYDPSTYRFEANAPVPVPRYVERGTPEPSPEREIVVPARPSGPPKDEWLPRAELASAEGVACVTSTAGLGGLRAPQPRPATSAQEQRRIEHRGRAATSTTDALPSPTGQSYEELTEELSEDCAATRVLPQAFTQEFHSGDLSSPIGSPGGLGEDLHFQPAHTEPLPESPNPGAYEQQHQVLDDEPRGELDARQQAQGLAPEPVTTQGEGQYEEMKSGYRAHVQERTKPPNAIHTERNRPASPGLQPAAAERRNEELLREQRAEPTRPQQANNGQATKPGPPASQSSNWFGSSHPASKVTPDSGNQLYDLQRLHKVVCELADQFAMSGFDRPSQVLKALRGAPGTDIEPYCGAIEATIPALQELNSAVGGDGSKHYLRELRRRVSLLSGELRESQAQLGELLSQDWARALSQSKTQVRHLECMLHDRQRDLEEAQQQLVSKLVVQDGGSDPEARLHAFVSQQAREVSLAKSAAVEFEKRCEELLEQRVREAGRVSEMEKKLKAVQQAESARMASYESRVEKIQANLTETNMKLAKVAAGGKSARKNAAEVLVAQVHALEAELRQQWVQHQAQIAAMEQEHVGAEDTSELTGRIRTLEAELEQYSAQSATAAELVQLRESTSRVHVELESLRRENSQLRGVLVARGGSELVDDDGPISCLSEVISRRDETIAALKQQVETAKKGAEAARWDATAWQRSEAEAAKMIPNISIPEEDFGNGECSVRSWAGLAVPMTTDDSEEGLRSFDSADQFDVGMSSLDESGSCIAEDSIGVMSDSSLPP